MSLNRNTTFCIKLQLGAEIRKVAKIPIGIKELKETFMVLYGKDNFVPMYQDEEGDSISITTDLELRDVIEKAKGKLSVKLVLKETEQVSVVDKLENLRQSLLNSVSGEEFRRMESEERDESRVLENLEHLSEHSFIEEDPVLIEEEKKSPELSTPVPKSKSKKSEKKPKAPKEKKPSKPKKEKLQKPVFQAPKSEPQSEAPKSEPQSDAPIVHTHITCDSCNIGPIIGIRYKCTVCYDYDLCDSCEASQNHVHPLIKIRTPTRLPADPRHQNVPPFFNQAKCFILGHLKQELKKGFKASVKSQKYPEEILALPGSDVEIEWKVKNAGKKTWPEGTRVILDSGEFDFNEVVIKEVKPGDSVNISIKARVSKNEGMFKGVWRLVSGTKVFGKLNAKVRSLGDKKIHMLVVNMGFDIEKARMALEQANGDVNLAISQIFRA